MKLIFLFLILSLLSCILMTSLFDKDTLFHKNIWHKSKSIISYERDGKSTNQLIFDIYSFSHFQSGIILYFITNKNELFTFIIATLFEIIENSSYIIQKYRNKKEYKNYVGDSFVNIISDIIIVLLGFQFCNLFNKKYYLFIIVILFEIFLIPFHANLLNTLFGISYL